ncbi:MAG: oxygen-independent coproporphyrinogen III oxidase [Planctomycetota bacterium]
MIPLPVLDRGTFARYSGLSLPRHVAYPMPTWWRDVGADEADRIRRLSSDAPSPRDLSLYVHLPFCEQMCRFCACNRTIMRKDTVKGQAKVERYIDAVIEEMRRRAEDVGNRSGVPRTVRQIHWGGGTPTYLSLAQIDRLHSACASHFRIDDDAEVSIEVDPRVTIREQLELLHRLGFNRISFGVQDFDPRVQEHVNRIQPLDMVRATTEDARAIGFESVNYDLIYGLPYQTLSGVIDTIERTRELRPDRIAFYHYAQIPDKIANQRGLNHEALPDSDAKLAMMLEATARFVAEGYTFVGLDHFALPTERLAKAMRDGQITRSFQGMTTGAELDLIGVGCSSISVFPRTAYLQNVREPSEYADCVLGGGDPAMRGLELSLEDGERQALLMDLYCHGGIDPSRLERLGVDAGEYLQSAAPALDRLEADGLIRRVAGGGIRLTEPLGRVLMRNVAAAFDPYLGDNAPWSGMQQTFSASA